MNFRRELYSPENLLLSSVVRLEPLARENLSHSATGLCEDKDFPSRTTWIQPLDFGFPNFSCLVWWGNVRARIVTNCELVSAEPTCSQRAVEFVLDCTATGAARRAPQSQGWECWTLLEPLRGAAVPAGMQLLWICLLVLSPASTQPWAVTSAAALRALLEAWREGLSTCCCGNDFCVGSESQAGLICSQSSVFVQSEWLHGCLCSLYPSTYVLQNSFYLLEHNPLGESVVPLRDFTVHFSSGFCGDRFNNTQGMLSNCRFQLF